MHIARRLTTASVAAVAALALTAGPALAHECVNASKKADAGAQILLGPDENIVWVSKGVQQRIDKGVIDPETGEGFSGLIGFDMNGDGTADLTTWIVGPDGEIPLKAQYNGPVCRGVTNIELWFKECMPA